MKITKELKYSTFEWNEDAKTFTINDKEGNEVRLNKVYAFAFMRFVVRMAQRNWLKGKKRVDNKGHTVVSFNKEELETPHQLIFDEIVEEDQWQ